MGDRIKTKQIKNFATESETVAQNITKYLSAGVLYPPPSISDNGDGTIDIGSCIAAVRSDQYHQTVLIPYTIAAATNVALTDGEVNYVCVDYNSGTPIYTVVLPAAYLDISESDVIPVYTIARNGLDLRILSWDSLASGLPNKLHARLVKTDRFARESGFALTESGTRNVNVASGVMWNGGTRNELAAVDSTVDEFEFWFKTSSVWTKADVTQYNNSQYQGTTDLVTLTTDYYTVNWIYRCSCTGMFGMLLGDNEYETIGDAQVSDEPPEPFLRTNGFLVGRIIVKEGENTAVAVQSAFDEHFPISGLADHGNLSGLTDDDHLQYALLNGRSGDDLKIDNISEFTPGAGTTFDDNVNFSEKINIGDEVGTPGLAVSGDVIWDGTNFQGYDGSNYKKLDRDLTKSTLQTTDNTTTTIDTVTGLPNSSASFIKVYVTAHNTGTETEYASFVRTLTVLKNSSGTASIPDTNADLDASTGLTLAAVSFSVSGGDVLLEVAGETATTINWICNYEVIN